MNALWNVFGSSHSLSSIAITDEDPEYENDATPAPFHGNSLTLDAVTSFEVCGNPLVRPLLQHLTLPRIQKLDLAKAPFNVVHRFISSSADLRNLSLYGVTQIPANLNPVPISFPVLSSLYISGFPRLLDYIHAPQLDHLVLKCSPKRAANSRTSLRTLIERSAPVLTSLHLRGVDTTDEDIFWCLDRLPHLEAFSLSSCPITDAVLHALAVPPSPEQGTGWLLPRLKTIGFDHNTHVTPQGVIKLLTSRSSNSAPRITGKVDFAGKLSKEDAQTILSYGDFLGFFQTIMYRVIDE